MNDDHHKEHQMTRTLLLIGAVSAFAASAQAAERTVLLENFSNFN